MVLANRHLARRAQRLGMSLVGEDVANLPQEYSITHPDHVPDMRGEFAGQKVYYRGGQQFVRLTPRQAQFYLDQGALEPVVSG